MVKCTFPHMGNLYIPARALLVELGYEPIIPPPCSKRTLSIGSVYAPETCCLPLKINIGNYLEAAEQGAEAIVMVGGIGPCRFGFYGQVQKEILDDLKLNLDMIIIEPPAGGWQDCLQSLHKLRNGKSMNQVAKAVVLAWEKFQSVDKIEATVRLVRPVAKNSRVLENEYADSLRKLDEAMSVNSIRRVTRECVERLQALKMPGQRPRLRIGLVGEIYTVLEPFVNQEIERVLGKLGVLVERTVHLGHWVKYHVLLSALRPFRNRYLVTQAQGYLRDVVGGHGLESVAHSVQFARSQNVDGVIHLLPFTCMPEIIAQSILVTVSRDLKLPIMTLVLDEQTAEAGYQTRIEAFLDLLEHRKQAKETVVR